VLVATRRPVGQAGAVVDMAQEIREREYLYGKGGSEEAALVVTLFQLREGAWQRDPVNSLGLDQRRRQTAKLEAPDAEGECTHIPPSLGPCLFGRGWLHVARKLRDKETKLKRQRPPDLATFDLVRLRVLAVLRSRMLSFGLRQPTFAYATRRPATQQPGHL
jgi:hypothetical protein